MGGMTPASGPPHQPSPALSSEPLASEPLSSEPLPSGPLPPSRQAGGAFGLARRARGVLRRVPVWAWRALMHSLGPGEKVRFNAEPVTGVDYFHDIDFVGDGIRAHRLDVITPAGTGPSPAPGPPPEPAKMPARCRSTSTSTAGAGPPETRLR